MQVRTQPEIIIQRLEADNSRLVKEDILAEAMKEELDEFFEGAVYVELFLFGYGIFIYYLLFLVLILLQHRHFYLHNPSVKVSI